MCLSEFFPERFQLNRFKFAAYSETDFVARNDTFQELVRTVTGIALAGNALAIYQYLAFT